jgi:hypothetical protein
VIYFRGFNSLPKSLEILKAPIKEVFEEASVYYEKLGKTFSFEIVD